MLARILLFLLISLNCAFAQGTYPSPIFNNLTINGKITMMGNPSPAINWTTGGVNYHYSGFESLINSGIPDSAKFGYGYGSVIEGITSGVDVPAGSTALQSAGISGYMRVQGLPAGVGVYGGCMQSANATRGCWALNTVATNTPTTQPVTQTGFDFGFLGTEIDTNLMKKPGGTAPTGNVIGLLLIGASETQPVGSSDGIRISQLGIGANIKWNTSILLADGASNYGIWRGPAEKSTNNVGSLPDAYVSKNSGGSILVSYISSNSDGELVLNSAVKNVTSSGSFQVTPTTFATGLGGSSTCSDKGKIWAVTDGASSLAWGANIAGGGSTYYTINCNGTNWTVMGK